MCISRGIRSFLLTLSPGCASLNGRKILLYQLALSVHEYYTTTYCPPNMCLCWSYRHYQICPSLVQFLCLPLTKCNDDVPDIACICTCWEQSSQHRAGHLPSVLHAFALCQTIPDISSQKPCEQRLIKPIQKLHLSLSFQFNFFDYVVKPSGILKIVNLLMYVLPMF